MRGISAVFMVGSMLVADVAMADEVNPTNYPGTFVDRPLTLRGGDIRFDARYQFAALNGPDVRSNQVAFGAAVGITDRLELAVTHSRDASYDLYDAGGFLVETSADAGDFADRIGNVYAAGRFAFLDGEGLAAGVEFGIQIPTHQTSDIKLVAGLPLRAHLGNHFNLDIAPELGVRFSDDGTGDREANLDLNIPVAGVLQFGQSFWIAGNSGVFWPSFDLDEFYLPLIFEMGFTIKNGYTPAADIELQAGFPQLFLPGANDGVNEDFWIARCNLRFFLAH